MVIKTDHDKLTEVHAVIVGINGNTGLLKMVEQNTKAIHKLWIAVIIIATSVGGGIYGIIELLRGM